jgi:AcrR family transcriptional regulator
MEAVTSPPTSPKWRRRKEERPRDIIAAALAVFAEKGFAGARMEEIARRAGLSKGALYLYFPTKEAMFRAVVRDVVVPNVEGLKAAVAIAELPFAQIVRTLLPRFAEIVTTVPVGAVAKMVIGESRNFPELARVWHDEVILKAIGIIAGLIEGAQARGEIRPGDPRIHAFSIMGPMLMGVLWRETFMPIGGAAIDLPAIARQHAETVLGGLLEDKP